jgi:hypothetical protein
MAQQPDTLDAGLIRKGEARGTSPALATPAPPIVPKPAPAPVPTVRENPTVESGARPFLPPYENAEPDPPLRALPPDDVPKRFTSFRLPVTLDEELRAMIFETRRTKQDLLIEFVTAGVQAWRRDRAKRG